MIRKLPIHLFIVAVLISLFSSCNSNKPSQKNTTTPVSQKDKVEIVVKALGSLKGKKDNFTVTFVTRNKPEQEMVMVVGAMEAQMLVVEIEKVQPTAPLPLDLLTDFITQSGYQLDEVLINGLDYNVYTAQITCSNQSKTIRLKTRPVDAVTMALKMNKPIYIIRNLLEQNSIK